MFYFQIEFQGQGGKTGNASLALTNISVSTHTCEIKPTYARPGKVQDKSKLKRVYMTKLLEFKLIFYLFTKRNL